MVYQRYVESYGPYFYKSVREGDAVHSIYLGKGSISHFKDTSYTTLDSHLKKEPEVNPFIGGGPVEAPKPKKRKLKVEHKTKEETKMTYLERAHLVALAKKYDIDRAEIDHKLSYDENKEILEQRAKENSYSQDEMKRKDLEAEQWTGEYKEFIENVSEDDEKWKDYF